MQPEQRFFFAIVIVLVDFMVYAVPTTACFVAYVLIARPRFVKRWIDHIYSS